MPHPCAPSLPVTSPYLAVAKAEAHDYCTLTNIWERAVRATHDFLSEAAILDIRNDVFDIYLRAMDVYVCFLVWNTIPLAGDTPVYPLPQRFQAALFSGLPNKDRLQQIRPVQNEALPEKRGGNDEIQRFPLGFLGLQETHIEMLFIDQPYHRLGLGEVLIRHALDLGALSVDVNEQNPSAHAFYMRMGFTQYDRSPLDGQGNPFPILHLRLTS